MIISLVFRHELFPNDRREKKIVKQSRLNPAISFELLLFKSKRGETDSPNGLLLLRVPLRSRFSLYGFFFRC